MAKDMRHHVCLVPELGCGLWRVLQHLVCIVCDNCID